MPSERAEFSHPDITLVFTTLSYLYDGLTSEQLGVEACAREYITDIEYDCSGVGHGWLLVGRP